MKICLAIATLAATGLIAACGQSSAPPAADPYDISKMDLKPVPAKVSAVTSRA